MTVDDLEKQTVGVVSNNTVCDSEIQTGRDRKQDIRAAASENKTINNDSK